MFLTPPAGGGGACELLIPVTNFCRTAGGRMWSQELWVEVQTTEQVLMFSSDREDNTVLLF